MHGQNRVGSKPSDGVLFLRETDKDISKKDANSKIGLVRLCSVLPQEQRQLTAPSVVCMKKPRRRVLMCLPYFFLSLS